MVGHLDGMAFLDNLIPEIPVLMAHDQYHVVIFLQVQFEAF